jgi:hypothetical protein
LAVWPGSPVLRCRPSGWRSCRSGAYAIGVYRHRWLPRHTADLAAVTAAAHVLLLLSFIVGSGFFSLEGAVITVVPALLWAWILLTGISMIRCTPQVALAARFGAP